MSRFSGRPPILEKKTFLFFHPPGNRIGVRYPVIVSGEMVRKVTRNLPDSTKNKRIYFNPVEIFNGIVIPKKKDGSLSPSRSCAGCSKEPLIILKIRLSKMYLDHALTFIKKNQHLLSVFPLWISSCFASSGRKVPASDTTPIACVVPRSMSLVSEAGLISTQIVFTLEGR